MSSSHSSGSDASRFPHCCGFEGPGQIWANVNSKMLEALHDLIYLAVDGGGLRTSSKAQYYLLCL